MNLKNIPVLFVLGATLCWSMDDNLAKGRFRFNLLFSLEEADLYFDHAQTAVPFQLDGQPADYTGERALLTLEYGWTSDITLLFQTSYDALELNSSAGSVDSSGSPGVYMAVRQRLNSRGGFRITAESGVFVPGEADRTDPLPLGSDGIDWVLAMGYKQSFIPTKGGFELDFGYRFRNESPADEYFVNTALWFGLWHLGLGRIHYKTVESTREQLIEYGVLAYPNERGFQRLGFEIEGALTRTLSLKLGYGSTLEGRNQFETSGWQLGFTWVK